MKDKDFLIWLHKRLEKVHNENPNVDYMHKLKAIIRNTPEDNEALSSAVSNTPSELVFEEFIRSIANGEVDYPEEAAETFLLDNGLPLNKQQLT